jgi:hypothetical protein
MAPPKRAASRLPSGIHVSFSRNLIMLIATTGDGCGMLGIKKRTMTHQQANS